VLATLPVPDLFLATHSVANTGRRGIRGNLGFESLTLSPGGTTLWTANERALKQDLADDSKTVPCPVRLLRYDRHGESFVPGAQYVYPVGGIAHPGPGFALNGLAELHLLPDGSLLALEREFTTARGMAIRLYRVTLAGATDVSGLDALDGVPSTPVRKTLLYDFAKSGFVPDNLEGITWGPVLPDGDRTLVLVSDDNFEPLQQTQIVALRLHEKR
jgi:3-phytase